MDEHHWRVETVDHRDRVTAGQLVEVQRRAYRIEAGLIGFDGMPGLTETVDDVMALDLVILGVRHAGWLIGAVGYAVEAQLLDIDRVVVDPVHFRQGVATALLRAIDTPWPVEVMTGAENLPAVTLYTALGYDLVRTEESQGIRVARFRKTPAQAGTSRPPTSRAPDRAPRPRPSGRG